MSRPAVSVIVFARESSTSIRPALESLARQAGIEDAEVIVADGSSDGTSEIVTKEFPWVRHLRLDPDTMPASKAAAIREARGDVIAILDVHDVACEGWLTELREGLRDSGAEAVGGTVEFDGPMTAVNCAGYLFEYGAFAHPLTAGPTAGDLPGNNVAYHRRVFDDACADLLPGGFWKPFFHRRVRELGGRLHLHPQMRVRHHIRHSLLAFCVRRYHYGRCFGAMRLRAADTRHRLLYLVFSPTVPLLLSWRHFRRAWGHRGNRRLLLRCFPALALLCCSWGVGEWLGTWFGCGRSCGMVY